jgi:tRNA A37 threonylcarbamoyladenosine dehydratase
VVAIITNRDRHTITYVSDLFETVWLGNVQQSIDFIEKNNVNNEKIDILRISYRKFSPDVETSNTDRDNNFIDKIILDVFDYFLDKCFALLLHVL